jgi:hypothetical protein
MILEIFFLKNKKLFANKLTGYIFVLSYRGQFYLIEKMDLDQFFPYRSIVAYGQ